MQRAIQFLLSDGNVSIMYSQALFDGKHYYIPSEESLEFETEDAVLSHMMLSLPKDIMEAWIVDIEDIPKDREFRNSWTIVKLTGKMSYDLDRARNIQLQRMRAQREPKLKTLDVEYLRALENIDLDKIDRIKREKAYLRNITENLKIKPLTSIEDVKVEWPKDFVSWNS